MLTQTCCTHILEENRRNGYNYDYDISLTNSIGTSITRGILLLLPFDHVPSIPSKEGYDEVDGEVEEEGGEKTAL